MNMPHILEASASRKTLTLAAESCQPHLRPIIEAVRDHGIGMFFVPQSPESFRLPSEPKRPAVIIIGDDFDSAHGPGGFHAASVRRAIRTCHAFAVISSAPIPAIYGTAASMVALTRRNCLLVETRPEQELAWVGLIQKLAPGAPLLLSTVKGGNA